MEYIDVQWLHKSEADPVRLVSELNDARYETRKLEFYVDGRVGLADGSLQVHGTELGTEPVPTLSEINSEPQFIGKHITFAEFEGLWRVYSL